MTSSQFVDYWREAEAVLRAHRWPPLPMGRAHLYWLLGFTAEQAAEAETLRRLGVLRKVH